MEANPETVTPELAELLLASGVNRVSLGAQSFRPHLLAVLERRASPDDVRRAVHTLRDAGCDNISLDLIYGIPGQSAADLDADLADALALEPEHLSCYELEAKPGTRFTHAHGAELERQAEAMEDYFEQVVDTLTGAGYRWYETANFCLAPSSETAPAAGTSERGTTSRTGSGGTTSGSAWARSRRSEGSAAAISHRSGATSRRSRRARRRLASSSRSTPRRARASGCCSGCGSTSRSRSADVAGALDRAAAERLAARGLVELGANGGGADAHADPARPLPRRRRDRRAAGLSGPSARVRPR